MITRVIKSEEPTITLVMSIKEVDNLQLLLQSILNSYGHDSNAGRFSALLNKELDEAVSHLKTDTLQVPNPTATLEVARPLATSSLIDVIAAHILPVNREFTIRVHKMTNSGIRAICAPVLTKVFPAETKAREFYGRTQNIWNMRARTGEAPGYEVVLGVQDERKHAKKDSYREVETILCNGAVILV